MITLYETKDIQCHSNGDVMLNPNQVQIDKLNQICARYNEKPKKIWLDRSYDGASKTYKADTLFAQFSNILIGIETDGYSHS
jgi:hypothetical protein